MKIRRISVFTEFPIRRISAFTEFPKKGEYFIATTYPNLRPPHKLPPLKLRRRGEKCQNLPPNPD